MKSVNPLLVTEQALPQNSRAEGIFLDRLNGEEMLAGEDGASLAWLCSYTPVEIIAACGLLPRRMLAVTRETLRADVYLHPTLCSYVRAALEHVLAQKNKGLQGAVLLNSCNAACHLSHAFASLFPQAFHYLLDLPRSCSAAAVDFWAVELQKMHHALARYLRIDLQPEAVQEQIELYRQNRLALAALYAQRQGVIHIKGSELLRLVQASMLLRPQRFQEILNLFAGHAGQQAANGQCYRGPRLLLTGSVAGANIPALIEEQGGVLVLDDLCLGRRAVSFDAEPHAAEDPYHYLARLYLTRSPCARMQGAYDVLEHLPVLLDAYNIEGIIFYYIKFCDAWYYLGQLLKERIKSVPVLILEGEHTAGGGGGQTRTRIEAFLEMLA